MVIGRSGATSRSWRPGLGAVPGRGRGLGVEYSRCWDGVVVPSSQLPPPIPAGSDYTALAVPGFRYVWNQDYTMRLPDPCYREPVVKTPEHQAEIDRLIAEYWGEVTAGTAEWMQPVGAGTGVTVIPAPPEAMIDDPYTLPTGGGATDAGAVPTSETVAAPAPSPTSPAPAYTPAVGGGNVDVGTGDGGPSPITGMEFLGIPVLYWALGAGALFLMTRGQKGRF